MSDPLSDPNPTTPTSVEVMNLHLNDNGSQPYVLESSNFDMLLASRRTVAIRIMQDLEKDMERLQLEINQRRIRYDDLALIVARANAALGIETSPEVPRPAPVLSDHSEG